MLLTTTSTYTARLSAEGFFKRGVYKVLLTDYRGAIDDFTQAIRLHPNDAKGYTNQVFAHAALGDQQGVIKDFNQAIRINPENADGYHC
jgi:tetratricopeptide (TPR) repeat protein